MSAIAASGRLPRTLAAAWRIAVRVRSIDVSGLVMRESERLMMRHACLIMMYARLMTTRELGRTGLYVSPIGLGCMQIAGRGIVATMFPAPPQTQVDEIIKAALDGGITWFDTAEMYGHGGSERALSNGLVHAGIKPGDVTVATKWAPFGRTAKSIERTIDDRLAALDPFPVDLHQIHMGFGSFSST